MALNRFRSGAASFLYGLGAALFLASAVLAFTGGFSFKGDWLSLSVQSWKTLRWIVVAIAAGYAVDPRRDGTVESVRAFVERRRSILVPATLAYLVLYLCFFKITEHLAFRTNAYDFSVFHHALHNTLHGDFLVSFETGRHFWSQHLCVILLPLTGLYALFPSPFNLQLVQALAVAAVAFPLYRIARLRGTGAACAVLIVVAFLFDAAFWRGFAYGFHVELFTPLAVFLLFWAYLARRWTRFYLAALVLLSIKEEMAVVLLFLGIYMLIRGRGRRIHGGGAAVLALVWGLLAWKVVMPGFHPEDLAQTHLVGRWSHLGGSLTEIALRLTRSPLYILKLLFSRPALVVFQSYAFLPVLDPLLFLSAAPLLLMHMTSNYATQAGLVLYYPVPALSLLVVAAAGAVARIRKRFGGRAAFICALLPILLTPGGEWSYPITDRTGRVHDIIEIMPPGAPVTAQGNLIPHLPPSKEIELFPEVYNEWILIDMEGDFWPIDREEHLRRVADLLSGDEYGVVRYDADVLLLHRGAPTDRNAAVLGEITSR